MPAQERAPPKGRRSTRRRRKQLAIRQGAPGARLGVNLAASELTSADLDSTLSGLADSGFQWVRFTLPWDEIEPQQGQYDWSAPDAVFAALARTPTLKPVVVLNGSPLWARRPGDVDNPLAPPKERADFGAFAAQVAQRYGEQIQYYQVWDEPNIAPHWGARPVDPADYLGLLREAAIQLRAADSDAVVLLGALAPTTESGGANLSDLAYLDALYGLAGQQWFDIVAIQPYGFSDTPDAPPAPDRLNFGRAALLHDVMARHGQGGQPVWATAFGWNALPAGWAGPPSPWGQVTEPEQAAYATRALELGGNEWGWLGPMFWADRLPATPARRSVARFRSVRRRRRSATGGDGAHGGRGRAAGDAARRPRDRSSGGDLWRRLAGYALRRRSFAHRRPPHPGLQRRGRGAERPGRAVLGGLSPLGRRRTGQRPASR